MVEHQKKSSYRKHGKQTLYPLLQMDEVEVQKKSSYRKHGRQTLYPFLQMEWGGGQDRGVQGLVLGCNTKGGGGGGQKIVTIIFFYNEVYRLSSYKYFLCVICMCGILWSFGYCVLFCPHKACTHYILSSLSCTHHLLFHGLTVSTFISSFPLFTTIALCSII